MTPYSPNVFQRSSQGSPSQARRIVAGVHADDSTVAQAVAQRERVVGKAEVHVAYFRGSPSRRSATMFFCTSLVPA